MLQASVCLDSARLTRIFSMLASSALLGDGEQCTNFVHDISRVGVRLSGCTLPFLDITQTVRCPSRGEDRGKIRDGRYQHSGLLAEQSGRDDDVIQAFSCLISRISWSGRFLA